jgi:hypothetical protein
VRGRFGGVQWKQCDGDGDNEEESEEEKKKK